MLFSIAYPCKMNIWGFWTVRSTKWSILRGPLANLVAFDHTNTWKTIPLKGLYVNSHCTHMHTHPSCECLGERLTKADISDNPQRAVPTLGLGTSWQMTFDLMAASNPMIKTIPSDPKVASSPLVPHTGKWTCTWMWKTKGDKERHFTHNIYSNQLSTKATEVNLKTEAEEDKLRQAVA